jgi:hypothetical protein
VGLTVAWQLPIRAAARVALCAVLAVGMVLWLLFYGLLFVCRVFGDCL